MDFKAIQALTADDMAKVNETIQAQLNSDVSLINQLGSISSVAVANAYAHF
ncbi:octaprenyl diphosphate synthase [Vibrio ponticus]|nr:octaprenyl diphosphate synthase [Vibrio ponticus]